MPTTCSPYAGEMPARDKIVDIYTDGYLQATERQLRFATAGLGLRLSPGATILDFGCGIGSSVRALLAQGYDAYGVDVLEYWDRDFDKYWLIGDKPPPEVAERLKLADPANYRLPFEDGTFDFCFSDQVFEHIFDYKTTMSEIVRVLKPSGLSLHNFPGPNNFMEGHVNLPFPWLCFSRSYLTLCAWISAIRGTEPDWRGRSGAIPRSCVSTIIRQRRSSAGSLARQVLTSVSWKPRHSCFEAAAARLQCLDGFGRSRWIGWRSKSPEW
jgi:SAM-dependent methyltransferase